MELNIKELVKQHFNLVDANSDSVDSTEMKEAFATIKTADGELTMEYDELAAGKPIFLLDEEGNKVAAPTGDFILENGKSIRVEEGIIADVKEVEDMEEEEVKPDGGEETAIEENLSAVESDEKVEVEAEASTEQSFEETEDEKESMEEDVPMPVLEEVIKQIAAVIEEKLDPMNAKIAEMESKMEKMSVEPATEKTIVKSKSSAEIFESAETPTARMVMNALSNPNR